ncbi:MAG: hypothetical protein FWG64_14765 [Firmicutes bacterium]|nr:hypothetical protein [Bacillota bacterium]
MQKLILSLVMAIILSLSTVSATFAADYSVNDSDEIVGVLVEPYEILQQFAPRTSNGRNISLENLDTLNQMALDAVLRDELLYTAVFYVDHEGNFLGQGDIFSRQVFFANVLRITMVGSQSINNAIWLVENIGSSSIIVNASAAIFPSSPMSSTSASRQLASFGRFEMTTITASSTWTHSTFSAGINAVGTSVGTINVGPFTVRR